ncbi:hypothetical protein [Mycobacterium colombiense]|uniref:hypothetical protein n=1 Tax=Mycobacterium colombiense TaxID=339268 RepID=UPI000A1974E9|nr:hypothetical protein [Mycobacterium colombiense]
MSNGKRPRPPGRGRLFVCRPRQTVDALSDRPISLTDRGFHALKGKSAQVLVFGIGEDVAVDVG